MKQNFRNTESGGVTVQMLFFTIVFAILGGLAVDVTNAYQMRTAMQATADAAAAAGVRELPDANDARTTAANYVELNMPASVHGTMANAGDYLVGNWDAGSRTFTANSLPFNAMRVNLTRGTSYGNPVATYLLKFAGVDTWDIRILSTALFETAGGCVKGFITNGTIDMNSNNTINDGFCLYARGEGNSQSIFTGSDFTATEGSYISTLSNGGDAKYPVHLETNSGSVVNAEMELADIEATRAVGMSAQISDWINAANNGEAGVTSGEYAGYTYHKVSGDKYSGPFNPDTIYLFTGNATFGKFTDITAPNVIIAAKKSIDFGEGSMLDISNGKCSTNADKPLRIFAGKEVKFGQNTKFYNVDVVAGVNVDMGSTGVAFDFFAESVDGIKTNSSSTFSLCNPGSGGGGGGGGTMTVSALVQ